MAELWGVMLGHCTELRCVGLAQNCEVMLGWGNVLYCIGKVKVE